MLINKNVMYLKMRNVGLGDCISIFHIVLQFLPSGNMILLGE